MPQLLPLCVDLDGSLIYSDSLYEAAIAAVKRHPSVVWRFPVWLSAGRAHFKEEIGRRVRLRPDLLPYNLSFLTYLQQEKKRGRQLVLASGSNRHLVWAIAKHLGLFTTVVASDATANLSGSRKAAALSQKFGAGGFIYAGNSSADIPVWKQASSGIVVNASPSVLAAAKKVTKVDKIFPGHAITFTTMRRALRIHQWVKNLLVFIPLLMAHRLLAAPQLQATALAFIVFCLTASSIYIINDTLDIEADRQHPSKKLRPFAAGTLSIRTGLIWWAALVIASISVTLLLPGSFGLVMLCYILLNLAYSLYLKQKRGIDVVLLAGVYTLRLVAGAAAASIAISNWLLAFSLFLFLSLALIKRYVELDSSSHKQLAGRGYSSQDKAPVLACGLANSAVALLVFTFYITSQSVQRLYSHPALLWIILPLLAFWLTRVWYLATQGRFHDDPIVFAVRDSTSYAIGLLAAAAVVAAL